MRKRTKIVGGALLSVVAAGVLTYRCNRTPALSPDYTEVRITRGDLQMKVLSTGVVQAENRLEIKPPIPGRVEEVYVDEGKFVRKGQKLALMSSSERAALLDAARGKSPEEVKRWEEFYQAAPILAPIDGTIILRAVEPGQTVNQDTLLVMADRLTVKAQVDETDIAEIRLKQRAEIVLDAYPKQRIPAQVDQIAYDAKTINNVTTYIVDVLPDQTPPAMRSGMTANVTFYAETKQGVLRIPSAGVKTREGHSFALTPSSESGGTPVEREIRIGLNDGKTAEVVSGLEAGETILVPRLTSEKDGASKGKTNPFAPFAPRRAR
ncbi:MAG: efflux RND transporter periplasmic adaptor subunit [Pseudomonadota bacterium]